jgi:hypothetical protein
VFEGSRAAVRPIAGSPPHEAIGTVRIIQDGGARALRHARSRSRVQALCVLGLLGTGALHPVTLCGRVRIRRGGSLLVAH